MRIVKRTTRCFISGQTLVQDNLFAIGICVCTYRKLEERARRHFFPPSPPPSPFPLLIFHSLADSVHRDREGISHPKKKEPTCQTYPLVHSLLKSSIFFLPFALLLSPSPSTSQPSLANPPAPMKYKAHRTYLFSLLFCPFPFSFFPSLSRCFPHMLYCISTYIYVRLYCTIIQYRSYKVCPYVASVSPGGYCT